MIKYTDAGLVTDDPIIASMFLGEFFSSSPDVFLFAIHDPDCMKTFSFETFRGGRERYDEITIPYKLIKQAIEPVLGEAVFWFPKNAVEADHWLPEYKNDDVRNKVHTYVKACPLTIGKNEGELRELVERCEEAQDNDD